MTTWTERPFEVANLLNPAFCGEVLRQAILKYSEIKPEGMPFSMLFLILPIVLHRNTRELISPRQRSQMHTWLEENHQARIGLAQRAKNLIRITREAIAFTIQFNAVKLDERGMFTANSSQGNRRSVAENGEIKDCYKKAQIVGRWFARAGSTANIFIMWGIKP